MYGLDLSAPQILYQLTESTSLVRANKYMLLEDAIAVDRLAIPGRAGGPGDQRGDHGGGVVPPRPPQPQPKGSRLKATPTRRGSADLLRH